MHTPPFARPPRAKNIIHIDRTSDPARKAAFIRTCDAMLHGRSNGETFGLAVAEFSAANRPVLTSRAHHDHGKARHHLDTLTAHGDHCAGLLYNTTTTNGTKRGGLCQPCVAGELRLITYESAKSLGKQITPGTQRTTGPLKGFFCFSRSLYRKAGLPGSPWT